MSKRIPERGTPLFRHYWAERHMLEKLRDVELELQALAAGPVRYGDEQGYKHAALALSEAVDLFAAGWSKGEA